MRHHVPLAHSFQGFRLGGAEQGRGGRPGQQFHSQDRYERYYYYYFLVNALGRVTTHFLREENAGGAAIAFNRIMLKM